MFNKCGKLLILKINVLSCSANNGGKKPPHKFKKYKDGEKNIKNEKIISKFFLKKYFSNRKSI